MSGSIGGAAAGLEMLAERDREPGLGSRGSRFPAGSRVRRRHSRPEPRVRLGVAVGRARRDGGDGFERRPRRCAAASGAASGVGVRIDGEALPIDPGAREWWTARGRRSRDGGGGGRRRLRVAVRGAAKAAARCGSSARHVADPPLTKIGVFTKDPRELVVRARGTRGGVTERFRTLCASLTPTGKRSRRCRRHGIRVSSADRDARLALRSQRADVTEMTLLPQAGARLQFQATAYCKGETTASASACAPALRPPIRRSSRSAASCARDAEPALQRRVDGDGHRSGGARPHRRSVFVELQGGACSSAAARCA